MRLFFLAIAILFVNPSVAQPVPNTDKDAESTDVVTISPANIDPAWKAKTAKFCESVIKCNKVRTGKAAYCVKAGLKESGMTLKMLEGEQAKDLPRFLRRAGFVDIEMGLKNLEAIPDGSILVLDAHDTIKDGRTLCPKVYGNVLVKCENKWIDEQKNDLNFHFRRGCRTKGIWLPSEMVPPPKESETPKKN